MEAVVATYVLALAAAVLVPTWLLGGFERTELPEVEPKQTVSYEEVDLTVRSAKLQRDEDEPGKPWQLVVEVHVVNKLPQQLNGFTELVVLGEPVFPKLTEPDATLSGERANARSLPSELPRDVDLTWQVPGPGQVPEQVQLTLRKRTLQDDFAAEGRRWLEPKPWLTVTLPVERP